MSDAILISPTETKPAMISSALATSIMISPALAQAQSVPTRSLGSPLWDLAGRVPSLDLNFAQNRSLVDATTGLNLVTFSRTSDATFVGSNGLIQVAPANTPRFDHNPITGESLGLLVEEQRTNLLLRSEEFDDASWGKVGATVTANAATAPSNTATADKIIETVDNSGHLLSQSVAGLPDNTLYTFSVFAKASERAWIAPTITDKTGAISRVWFNLGTGTQGTTSATVNAFSSIPLTNGWYRLALTVSSGTGVSNVGVRISIAQADNTPSYSGDGASGLFVWGAQLE